MFQIFKRSNLVFDAATSYLCVYSSILTVRGSDSILRWTYHRLPTHKGFTGCRVSGSQFPIYVPNTWFSNKAFASVFRSSPKHCVEAQIHKKLLKINRDYRATVHSTSNQFQFLCIGACIWIPGCSSVLLMIALSSIIGSLEYIISDQHDLWPHLSFLMAALSREWRSAVNSVLDSGFLMCILAVCISKDMLYCFDFVLHVVLTSIILGYLLFCFYVLLFLFRT